MRRRLRGMRTPSQDRWQRLIDHIMRCETCKGAGSLAAQRENLCVTGQGLLDAWEATEQLDPLRIAWVMSVAQQQFSLPCVGLGGRHPGIGRGA